VPRRRNHDFVTIVVDPGDYATVIEDMTQHCGATTRDLRRRLARVAYARTAAYDAAIARWMDGQAGDAFPPRFTIAGKLSQTLRYGENPHQQQPSISPASSGRAWHWASSSRAKSFLQHFNDADCRHRAGGGVRSERRRDFAIIKHANPGAWRRQAILPAHIAGRGPAIRCRPSAASSPPTGARRCCGGKKSPRSFSEVIIAPGFTADALKNPGGERRTCA